MLPPCSFPQRAKTRMTRIEKIRPGEMPLNWTVDSAMSTTAATATMLACSCAVSGSRCSRWVMRKVVDTKYAKPPASRLSPATVRKSTNVGLPMRVMAMPVNPVARNAATGAKRADFVTFLRPFSDQRMPATAATAARYRSGDDAPSGSRYPMPVARYTTTLPGPDTAAAAPTPNGARLPYTVARGTIRATIPHSAMRSTCLSRLSSPDVLRDTATALLLSFCFNVLTTTFSGNRRRMPPC